MKQIFVLAHEIARQRAIAAVKNAPEGYQVVVSEPKRSSSQNAALWAALTDISQQVVWHGQKLSPDDWKNIFSASLKKQRAAPGLDGGWVVFGESTSRMSKKELSDLLALIEAFGAEHDVKFGQ